MGDNARAVQNLLEGLAADVHESISGSESDAAAVKAVKDLAQARLDELDQTLADGTEILKIYAEISPQGGVDRAPLEAWLIDKQADDGPDKPKIDRLMSFLTVSASESTRSEILATGDVDKLGLAIATAKNGIQTGLEKLDQVAAALTQKSQIEPEQPNSDFLEYLAEQEGNGDLVAGSIRQILSASQFKADIVAGKIRLADFMSAIDDATAIEDGTHKRSLLKAATKRLVDSYLALPLQRDVGRFAGPSLRFLSRPQNLTISGIIGLAGLVIVYGLIAEGVLESFALNDIARGFITLLFAVGAISIFMVITAAIVFDVNSTSREIYDRAKTILSMLLGIFGTVLGFYFGLPSDDADEEFVVRPIEFVEAEDRQLNFKTSVEGGTAPYQFFVHVADQKGNPLDNLAQFERNSNGTFVLSKPFDVAHLTAGTTVLVFVNALDSKGRTALSASEPYAVGGTPSDD